MKESCCNEIFLALIWYNVYPYIHGNHKVTPSPMTEGGPISPTLTCRFQTRPSQAGGDQERHAQVGLVCPHPPVVVMLYV